jgi:hypothetical protein
MTGVSDNRGLQACTPVVGFTAREICRVLRATGKLRVRFSIRPQ